MAICSRPPAVSDVARTEMRFLDSRSRSLLPSLSHDLWFISPKRSRGVYLPNPALSSGWGSSSPPSESVGPEGRKQTPGRGWQPSLTEARVSLGSGLTGDSLPVCGENRLPKPERGQGGSQRASPLRMVPSQRVSFITHSPQEPDKRLLLGLQPVIAPAARNS